MKKLTTLMLGLALVIGTTALFADDAAPTKKVEKTKKAKAKKTTEEKK